MPGPKPQVRVNTDNSTSDRYTIIDVFAYDRTGLLYAMARALFELGCSGLAGEDRHAIWTRCGRLLRDRPGEQEDRGPAAPGGDTRAASGGDWGGVAQIPFFFPAAMSALSSLTAFSNWASRPL